MKVLSNLDLNKNQLLQVVLQVLASAPTSPVEGQMYYNSTDQTAYIRKSSAWLDLGAVSSGADGLGPDGDKGDITVGGTGTTLTIDVDAVTYAKMQNVTTANTMLGSLSAGGIITELTKSQILTLINVLDGADVTNSTNVNSAGATMNSDTTLAGNGYFLDDDTMAGNDATKTVSQQSLVAYVASSIATALSSGMTYKGGYNASTNTPLLDATPIATAIGDTYTVTVAGTFFTVPVSIGDVIICESVNATTEAQWTIVEKNIPDIVSASETAQGIIELATQTEVNTGTDTVRAITPATLKSNLGVTATLNSALRFTQQIGNAVATNIVVTHNIGRQFVTAQVFETASPYAQVECDIECDTVNATSFTFNVAPSSNQYTVIIVG
jgi:hypothetical protein